MAVNLHFADGGSSKMATKTTTTAKSSPAKTNSSTKTNSSSVVKQSKSCSNEAKDDDQVRAPIAPIKEVLVKDYSFGFNGTTTQFTNWREHHTVEGQQRSSGLDSLFRPPVDLIFTGKWEAVKQAGEQQKKWLLVNIQSREFESEALNRDLWANGDVKSLVAKHFIFWQVSNLTTEGRNYVSFYHVDSFPHISILDPRTGEKLLHWQTITAKTFCTNVAKFLAENPSPGACMPSTSGQVNAAPKAKAITDLSEEDQINAAIEASIKLANTAQSASDTQVAPSNQPTGLSTWKEYLGPKDGNQIQLVIRFPDGKRQSMTFPVGTKVKALLLYITEQHGISLAHFDLLTIFPKKSLTTGCDEMATLEAVGIQPRDTLYLQAKWFCLAYINLPIKWH